MDYLQRHFSDIVFLSMVYVIPPILLARFVVGASWGQILLAYGILYGGLYFLLQGWRGQEHSGWMLISGMFLTIPGIPVISLGLRLLKVGG